jgi:hypothetical protein
MERFTVLSWRVDAHPFEEAVSGQRDTWLRSSLSTILPTVAVWDISFSLRKDSNSQQPELPPI